MDVRWAECSILIVTFLECYRLVLTRASTRDVEYGLFEHESLERVESVNFVTLFDPQRLPGSPWLCLLTTSQ